MPSPFQCQVGQRTQEVIGAIVLGGRDRSPDPSVVQRAVAAALGRHPLHADRRRGAQLIASMASAYLARFVPEGCWILAGVDIPLGNGRADLLWLHESEARLLIDELKAERGRSAGPDPEDLEQVERYRLAARAEYPGSIITLRLLVLGPPTRCHLFDGSGPVTGAPSGTAMVRP